MQDNEKKLSDILCEIEEYRILLKKAEDNCEKLRMEIETLTYKSGQLTERLLRSEL